MEALSNQELRKFITDHFDDSELITFCFDYFPEVQNNFAAGMRKNEKVMDLISYCRNRQLMTNLLTNLRQERQTTYQQAFNPQASFFAPSAEAKPRDPKQIFISYSTKDATPLATRLAKDLRDSGHPVWIAPESIVPGEKWGEAIDRGLQESGIFILLLTPKAIDSFWVKREMYAAMRLHERSQMRVLPLDVQACTPPPLWEEYQFVSFRDGYKKGRAQLWGALAGQPVKPLSRRAATPPAKKPPVQKQRPSASEVTEGLTSQLQKLPDWMKWGGLAATLLLVFGIGYAVFNSGGDDGDNLPTTIAIVEPTEEVFMAAVETSVEMPTNTHTVAVGDTLGLISNNYDVPIEDIMAANGMTEPKVLSIGQLLVIPIGGLPEPTAVSTTVVTAVIEISATSGDIETEAVLIQNLGGQQVALNGWQLVDADGHAYTFAQITLFGDGAAIQLHTGSGQDAPADLFWGLTEPIFTAGELLSLINSEGEVVVTTIVP